MEIRHIRPEENVLSGMLRNRVFLSATPVDYTERLKNPLEHSKGYENVWAGFDDDGKMISTLIVTPYSMMFDGHIVGMGGVGGVATLPESRAGGCIRKIFEKCMPEMYDKGMVFSYLYPFSHSFYRKFGYELSFTLNDAAIPMAALETYPRPSKITFYDKGGDAGAIKSIYDAFIADKNLAVARTEENMRHILEKDAGKQYVYVHHGEDVPDCYVIYSPKINGEGNSVMIKELAWSRISGLHGMIGFLAGLKPQFKNIKWEVPSCVNVYSLFPECYNVNQTNRVNGMNRIVNLQRAFDLMRYPDKSHLAGEAVISVTDAFFPVNTGTYRLEWENGEGCAKKISDSHDSNADMSTDIETMAQLVTGFMTPVEAAHKKTTKINDGTEKLTTLFPKKTLYLYEKF